MEEVNWTTEFLVLSNRKKNCTKKSFFFKPCQGSVVFAEQIHNYKWD